MNKEQRAVIDWAIESLTNEHEQWSATQYAATHVPTEIRVWHANGPPHVRVEWYDHARRATEKVGQYSGWPWLPKWRRDLHSLAHSKWLNVKPADRAPELAILNHISAVEGAS